jgi:hypothetical protein
MQPPQHFHGQMLACRHRRVAEQAELATLDAVAPAPHLATTANLDNRLGSIAVGVDDGRSPDGQQLVEQARLGREIGVHRRMIIEMLVRQIGEGGGGQAQTVEAMLVETVARRLDREMVDMAQTMRAAMMLAAAKPSAAQI